VIWGPHEPGVLRSDTLGIVLGSVPLVKRVWLNVLCSGPLCVESVPPASDCFRMDHFT